MDEKEKKRLIEENKMYSLEGLDSCLHGEELYKSCHACGREIEMKIPYHRPFPLSDDDRQALEWDIGDVLKSGLITNGEKVKELEDKIAEMYDVEHCIATSNCTIGLMLCYQYFKDTDKIYMPNFTWDSPYIVLPSYLDPKFVDIDLQTWLMNGVETNFDKQCIISPNHTFGNILNIEREYKIIFDGAHALGSKIENVGSATVFSLAPTKLVTSCEGGLVITNDKHLADFVRFRRDKCARMSEVHALIGLKTLFYLDVIKTWKKTVHDNYKKYIPGKFQKVNYNSNYNTIGFINEESLDIPKHIETRQYYVPIFGKTLLKNAYYVYKNIICLPSYYGCDYKKIIEQINEHNDL